MTPDLTTPGLYIEEVPSGAHEIVAAPTSIAAFVGWTARGGTDEATKIESWLDFEESFGGLDTRSLLSYGVYHFFNNGGRQAYVVRLTGDDAALQPNTAEFEEKLLSAGVDLLEVVQFNLLCVPGETTPSVTQSLQQFCLRRRAFLIVDCEQGATFNSLLSGPNTGITGTGSKNSALYFPWIQVPGADAEKGLVECPPCGFVAGLYARIDATHGVWKAPAGMNATLFGMSTPKIVLSQDESGTLNPRGINCILGNLVCGARTLRVDDPEWKYVPVRRLALFVEESLYGGTQWVVFEPNDEQLWARIRLSIEAFMHGLFSQGAFPSSTPREAYFVKCDRETTTQNDVDQGVVNIVVGFAPLKPAEFVIIRIQQIIGDTSPGGPESSDSGHYATGQFGRYKHCRVRIKWDGRYVAGANKVSTLEGDRPVIDYRDDNDPNIRKLAGIIKCDSITLERGITHDSEFEKWVLATARGEPFGKDLTIELYDEAGEPRGAYELYRCWVSGFVSSGVQTFQTITLQCEGFARGNTPGIAGMS